jgi:hypothetical protein
MTSPLQPLRRFAAVAALLLMAAPPAQAATLPAFSLPALVAEAHTIAIGAVVANHSIWHAFPGLPRDLYTVTEIAVSDTLAGPTKSGELLFVMQKGGEDAGISRTVAGTARFEPGDRVLVFARTDGGMHYLVGMAQGAFFFTRSAATSPRWVRPAAPHPLAAPDGVPLASPAADIWLETALVDAVRALLSLPRKP